MGAKQSKKEVEAKTKNVTKAKEQTQIISIDKVDTKASAKTDSKEKEKKDKSSAKQDSSTKQDSTQAKAHVDDDQAIIKQDKMNQVLQKRVKMPKNAL